MFNYNHINDNSSQNRSADYWTGDTSGKYISTSSGIDPVVANKLIIDTRTKLL